jgi:hypothetical protein
MNESKVGIGYLCGPELLGLMEIVKAEIYRGEKGHYNAGADETICVNDLIVTAGRVWLAKRICADAAVSAASAMAYMAVGTVATGAALGDTTLTGEVKRKALATNTAGVTASNIYTAVMTLGGSADSVSSLIIQEAGIFNHASSGLGTMFQRVTFASVTLANSDLLKLTLETNVGSS